MKTLNFILSFLFVNSVSVALTNTIYAYDNSFPQVIDLAQQNEGVLEIFGEGERYKAGEEVTNGDIMVMA